MDNICDNEGFDKLMEKYNFDSPIEVTLVIEEEDPPEPVLLKSLLVSNNTNVPNSDICSHSSEVYKRTDSNIDNAKNKMPMTEKNCNSISVEEEQNRSISAIQTVLPEEHRKKTQYIQWQLLDVVAENLIHITKCHYHNFINNKKQMADYEKLKLEYLTFKRHFFNLSYSTTIAILLPKENDIYFFNYFINRVIKIANRNSWYQISYGMLDTLIREMLIWTKQKKKNLDIKLGSLNHEKGSMDGSSSALTNTNRLSHSRQILNTPFDKGPSMNHATQGTNNQPDIAPKTHLPRQVINISPNMRHITNYSTQELIRPLIISPRMNYPIQDINIPNNSSHIKSSKAPKGTKKWHNNYPDKFHLQPENISPNFGQRTNHSHRGSSSPFNIERRLNNSTQERSHFPYNGSRINHSTETITSIYNNEPNTNNVSTFQRMNTDTSKIILSTGPPNHEITISVDSQIYANINQQNANQLNNDATQCHVNESHGTQSIKKRKTNHSSDYPYSNSNSMPHVNDNNFYYKKNNCSAKTFKSLVDGVCHDDSTKAENELINTDTLRSSISRDSGFGSPICGSFRSEPTIEALTNEEQESPIITHVTSMNANAVPNAIGICKVCGATTNNMCIGCYTNFYCSHLCQTRDWENHKYLCTG